MKYLVVGLGNIGSDYDNTRHNIGFKMLDFLAKKSSIFFSTDRYASICTLKHKGRSLILCKPSTFMNLSGKAVNYWMQKENIGLSNLIVLTDDLALPFGTIRIKGKGSDGGHNGLRDINATLGRNDYARLRFGVGNEFSKGKQVDYVLGKWTEEQDEALTERCEKASEAILAFSTIGLNRTMSAFNNK